MVVTGLIGRVRSTTNEIANLAGSQQYSTLAINLAGRPLDTISRRDDDCTWKILAMAKNRR